MNGASVNSQLASLTDLSDERASWGQRGLGWPGRIPARGGGYALFSRSFHIKRSRCLNHRNSLLGECGLWSTGYWEGLKIRPRKSSRLFLKKTLAYMTFRGVRQLPTDS